MVNKFRYCINLLLALFFILVLTTGESAFISFLSIYQSTAHYKLKECDPSALVKLWYDPREPDNHMVVQNDGRTIIWEGVQYSVLSVTPSEEDILYLCMTDNGDTYVSSGSAGFTQQRSNPLKDGLKGKVLLGQFIYQDIPAANNYPNIGQCNPCASLQVQLLYPEISPPPPRLA